MKRRLLILAMAVTSAFVFLGCNAQKQIEKIYINHVTITGKPQQQFDNLDRGLVVHVLPTNPISKQTGTIIHLSGESFFNNPTINYAQSMGLVEMTYKTDFNLFITIEQADVTFHGFSSYENEACVDISIILKDAEGNKIYSQKGISTVAKGRITPSSSKGLDKAYTQALEEINWNHIASFLRTEQLPKDEPDKQVQGLGDTALEQTIIRWDIQSRPQGADIFWRVVSKTPEVKSTNNKYLQTTPYEATKALDIKGLTHQTSSNVRIILRCEKDGYLPQEKEYDVRMVLDQEEISAFFRLVKDE